MTLASLDGGPVDATLYDLEGKIRRKPKVVLSNVAQQLRDQLDAAHSRYLNPIYPPDPSLWKQALCERFNSRVDHLLALLRLELGEDHEILDQQPRYAEDPRLRGYLATNPGLAALEELVELAVR
ncbi:hypothetical protein [Paracoccus siganidrum]|uniref:hypothetical protein n=1 Tax=Paracoccus siganidrum TaxID=1276757 RepID=UPI0011C38DBC|nr:hypothetical protein [Paracoccus siganidrum]